MLGYSSEPVHHLVDRHKRQQPQIEVGEWVPGGRKKYQYHQLPDVETSTVDPESLVEEPSQSWTQDSVAGNTGCISSKFPSHRSRGDRIKGVQQKIRLFGPELIPMMVHVGSTISMGPRTEGKPTKECDPHKVVDFSTCEQETVCTFVMEDKHSILNEPHEQDGNKG